MTHGYAPYFSRPTGFWVSAKRRWESLGTACCDRARALELSMACPRESVGGAALEARSPDAARDRVGWKNAGSPQLGALSESLDFLLRPPFLCYSSLAPSAMMGRDPNGGDVSKGWRDCLRE